ncbi:MAG TPA: MATE family efflux transporter [Alphaproteobacteria bacterium]|nr:MATE family efflux transporter [Alphaproteobacteria bacterium]
MSVNVSPPGSREGSAGRILAGICRLALPVVVARAGNALLQLTNVVMVGHAGPDQLALQSVGFSVAGTLQMIGLGLLTGTLVSVAFAYGRGEFAECGHAWRRSLPYALALGVVGAGVSLFGTELLQLSGEPRPFAVAAGRVVFIIGLSLPAYLLFVTTTFFLEGIGRPLPGVVMVVLGVIVNIGINWVLVYGNLGAPALGAEGAALATLIVRVVLALGLIGFAFRFRGAVRFGVLTPKRGSWRSWAQQRRIGHADGLSLGIESGAFMAMNLMASIIGTVHVAAYAIALSLLSIIFTFALGISSATAVFVSRAFGRRDEHGLRLSGWLGLGLNTVVVACAGLALVIAPDSFAKLYTMDDAVARVAAPLIAIVAVTLLADGGQRVVVQSLRGCTDTWFPTALHLLSYVIIMVPLGWALAFPAGLKSIGLLLAIAFASFASVIVLGTRFWWLSSVRLPAIWRGEAMRLALAQSAESAE